MQLSDFEPERDLQIFLNITFDVADARMLVEALKVHVEEIIGEDHKKDPTSTKVPREAESALRLAGLIEAAALVRVIDEEHSRKKQVKQ